MRRSFAVLLFLALAACPDVRRPETKDFVASGSVYAGGVERRGDALGGARVRAWPEGDLGSAAEATSDDGGFWKLSLPPASGRIVLEVAADGWVPATHALVAGPSTQLSWSCALEPVEELDCSSDSCTVLSDALRIDAAPQGASGFARAFDPGTGSATLAGLESLRTLGIAWVALDGGDFDPDAGGFASDGGAAASQLVLRLPFPAWSRLEDLTPGTGRIEVPVRQFDEASGQWLERQSGVLLSEAGLELPESALPALKRGEVRGGAVVVAPLPASGFWAVAAPAISPGCLEGTAEVEGEGAEGVLLEAAPREASASLKKGAFCVPASVSPSGEHTTLFLQYAGVSYAPVEVPLPDAAGRCGAGACTAVGKVTLLASTTQTARACKVTGTVKDASGAPLQGAVVVALDDSVPRGVFTTLCGKLATRCPLATGSDPDGHFEVVMPVQRSVQLSARALVVNASGLDGVREGGVRFDGCPDAPVDLVLRAGRDELAVEVQLAGAEVSWTPAESAAQLTATGVDGGLKWELVSATGFGTPVTYGQVPAGAQQRTPAAGSPAPLETGDELQVLLIGTDARGYQYSGSASALVP